MTRSEQTLEERVRELEAIVSAMRDELGSTAPKPQSQRPIEPPGGGNG